MTSHDAHLAQYRLSTCEVWCDNPTCPNHADPVTVQYESEYGFGWLTPEECECGGGWLDDEPVRDAPWDPQLSDAENLSTP